MNSKIVLDTSVFISAIIGPKGPSRDLLRQCFEGHYQPLMGNSLFCEYEAVSHRQEILAKTPLTPNEVNTLLCSFFSICQWMPIYYLWRPNLTDEQDNHLIELAIAGNADYLITYNLSDFNQAQLTFPDLKIVRPEQLQRRH
jgi:putative PIN family toxin of toxin-antitoxin system